MLITRGGNGQHLVHTSNFQSFHTVHQTPPHSTWQN